MNDKLPYEESLDQQLNDLPLPDEEQSWQKMKLLLENDDDDRIIPPVFFKGCMGWSLLFFIGLVAFWLIVHPEKWWEKRDTGKTELPTEAIPNTDPGSVKETSIKKDTGYSSREQINKPSREKQEPNSPNSPAVQEKKLQNPLPGTSQHQKTIIKQKAKNSRLTEFKKISLRTSKVKNNVFPSNRKIGKRNPALDKVRTNVINNDPVLEKDKPVLEKNIETDLISQQRDSTTKTNSLIKKDSLTKKDSASKKDSLVKDTVAAPVVKNENIKSKKKNKIYVSAGLGLQQQIPLAGQTAAPYNYYGRRGSISDYVPSLYLRLHRENKWFIQGEFRYGAPQSVKELAYEEQSVTDTSGTRTTITTLKLKKTFFHQLPLSFNYQILPGLTIGAGGIYSRFYRAIIEEEVKQKNNQTVTVLNKEIIPVYRNDSLQYFTNSQIHFLAQATYQWRKFSFGLTYTKGLQPFIRYTDANGVLLEEKNHSLQFAVKYRFWRSK